MNNISSSENRSRSKTFEEFEKDTDDAWDEEAGDIKHLSTDAKLEFEHSGSSLKGGAQKCKFVSPVGNDRYMYMQYYSMWYNKYNVFI